METFLTIIVKVLGDPTIVLGIVALLGLIFLKSKWTDVLLGTVKTMMGYVILMAGADIIGPALEPLTKMIRKGLGVEGVVPLYWPAFSESMTKFGTEIALIFIMGFVLNIFLAKFTRYNFLALTVHLQLFWCGFIVVVLNAAGFSGVSLLTVGGIISGIYFWIATGISYYYIRDNITAEHANFVPSVFGIILAGTLGKLFKKGSKSAEDLELPESLNWLKDNVVAMIVIMFLVNIIFAAIAGFGYVQKLAGDTPWILYLLSSSLSFGGAIAVILYGVRTLLAELIPAFQGISESLLPNAKLGLDYPTVYPYAGTSVMIGFLLHLLGSVVATLIMALTGFTPLVIPGVQINFFEGSLVGVYANARGGIKNVILSSFLVGFILQFGVALTFPYTGILVAKNVAYEAIDFNTFGLIIAKILSFF
ncbi:PTS transporter subunit IIC [Tepidanaerobacter syntrophicus]|uniref:PTS transporter subunit IIC n=1 Tax=Tepidanaerobacter syntrophicus TaxID=224999 RepID=UPI001BD629C7|nr:PTS transporter subunit IIC [Tepidanaerobacter syntrophicus]